MSTQSSHNAVEVSREQATAEREDEQDAETVDQSAVKIAAVALGVWLALTVAAVALLLVLGDPISGFFV
ncbi:hypothetical protein ACLI4Z_04010 [Natrialbaceae archaeon A-arb3/5]